MVSYIRQYIVSILTSKVKDKYIGIAIVQKDYIQSNTYIIFISSIKLLQLNLFSITFFFLPDFYSVIRTVFFSLCFWSLFWNKKSLKKKYYHQTNRSSSSYRWLTFSSLNTNCIANKTVVRVQAVYVNYYEEGKSEAI